MLTPAQLATLKAHIAANTATIQLGPDAVQIKDTPNNGDANNEVAAWYNLQASPNYLIYRTTVPVAEVMLNGFDWTRVDNLSVGKARIWEWINQSGGFNPSKTNIRAGIDACWTGTAPDLAVRAAVYVHCKRPASRLEKLFATGSGTDASPSVMVVEGAITYSDF